MEKHNKEEVMKTRASNGCAARFLAIVLTTVTIMGLPLTGLILSRTLTALAADKDIVVLYTNDVHCEWMTI